MLGSSQPKYKPGAYVTGHLTSGPEWNPRDRDVAGFHICDCAGCGEEMYLHKPALVIARAVAVENDTEVIPVCRPCGDALEKGAASVQELLLTARVKKGKVLGVTDLTEDN